MKSNGEQMDYTPLMDELTYQFSNVDLLRCALTHRSRANERSSTDEPHNERLEFLGDAVIDLSVGHYLMENLPDAREGNLSKLRSLVVSEAGLAQAAKNLDLGSYLRLGRGEEQTGGRGKASLLADAFEAVIGAIFVDGGFAAADRVARQKLRTLVNAALDGRLDRDHKTRLQELAQGELLTLPRYDIVAHRGPDHAKVFEVVVSLGGRAIARAEGTSKKEAEQAAARRALEELSASEAET